MPEIAVIAGGGSSEEAHLRRERIPYWLFDDVELRSDPVFERFRCLMLPGRASFFGRTAFEYLLAHPTHFKPRFEAFLRRGGRLLLFAPAFATHDGWTDASRKVLELSFLPAEIAFHGRNNQFRGQYKLTNHPLSAMWAPNMDRRGLQN